MQIVVTKKRQQRVQQEQDAARREMEQQERRAQHIQYKANQAAARAAAEGVRSSFDIISLTGK